MIAWAGIEKLKNKKISDSHDKKPKPEWSLEDL